MKAEDLSQRLFDRPFKPFRMHLSDGKVVKVVDVRQPMMVILSRSTAILPTRFGKDDLGHPLAIDWQTVALAHIVRFSDLRNGSQRPRDQRRK